MRLGLDIGGTKIEAALLNAQGETLYCQRYPTPKQSYSLFLAEAIRVIQLAQQQASASAPVTVGIGVPGTPDPSTGLIKNSNILVLNQQAFVRDLEQGLGMSVAVTNDANCFTLSEAMDGSGRGHRVVFGVILGTGCGGGLCIDQRPIVGPNACAGEWGHNSLPRYRSDRDGEAVACYCGQTNCIESFISGSGLERQYAARGMNRLMTPEIVGRVAAGDRLATNVWEQYCDQLARSLAGIVNILDPDIIVLGGGVSNVELLYSGLQQRVARYVFGGHCHTPIVRARHGDSSGVRGAAWLGAQPMKTLHTSHA